jgi:hypothetical protein
LEWQSSGTWSLCQCVYSMSPLPPRPGAAVGTASAPPPPHPFFGRAPRRPRAACLRLRPPSGCCAAAAPAAPVALVFCGRVPLVGGCATAPITTVGCCGQRGKVGGHEPVRVGGGMAAGGGEREVSDKAGILLWLHHDGELNAKEEIQLRSV